jgi:hypothetical protein
MRRVSTFLSIAMLLITSSIAFCTLGGDQAGAATTNWDPSGQAMPVGDLPGWHQIFADNFANDSYPLGTFTGCNQHGCSGAPSVPFGAVVDGHPDTSGNCEYFPSQTVSITGGVMRIFMHTNSKGLCMDASLYPLVPSLTYGMYSVRFRSAAVPGYKGVDLLWPVNKVNGEIDFPEANLDAPLHGFLHTLAGGQQQQNFKSTASWTSWHTATLEWTPTSVTFVLDGTTIGTTDLDVPQTPMTLVLRAESDLEGAPKPPASAHGSMEIDWVTVYSYVPPAGPAAAR